MGKTHPIRRAALALGQHVMRLGRRWGLETPGGGVRLGVDRVLMHDDLQ